MCSHAVKLSIPQVSFRRFRRQPLRRVAASAPGASLFREEREGSRPPFTCLKIQYRPEAWLSAVAVFFPLRFRHTCF
jgi:hypothetical protein